MRRKKTVDPLKTLKDFAETMERIKPFLPKPIRVVKPPYRPWTTEN